MLALKIIWWAFGFVIFHAMIGYPVSLAVLDRLFEKENKKDLSFEPTVTLMIVAHNEEKVILEKLENALALDYPADKLEILVASDFSTDSTNRIVDDFIAAHPDRAIKKHESVNHYGKTNAQNEASELAGGEILVMTDANSMMEKDSVRELVSYFTDDDIAYVSGKLVYVNADDGGTAGSEGFYWKLDLFCRDVESRFKTITAGNGAIYAVRTRDYVKINPIECHDSSFPVIYGVAHKRAIYNKNAVAYEKAGEVDEDEFKRKVRMNRILIRGILPDIRILNIFSYGWFSYFYFGHRTCRYLLWLAHLAVLAANVPLAVFGGLFWKITLAAQVLFYLVSILGTVTKSRAKLIKIPTYYCMTVIAQWVGFFRIITGRAKPVWEKAESTR